MVHGHTRPPNAIWVRCSVRIGSRSEPRRDFRVADHARGERHLECQQVTAHFRVEHVACIGEHLDRIALRSENKAIDFRRHSFNGRALRSTDTPAQGGGHSENSLSRHPSGCRPEVVRLTEGQLLMPLPLILQDDTIKRLVQGAAAGAVVTMIVGFNWGGWSLESTTAKRADEASRSAVVAVLAPICVDKFQHSADATSNFAELKKVSSYMQGSSVEKGGWATSPGTEKANSAVAQACATMLGNPK
jgi:hypothetical protein